MNDFLKEYLAAFPSDGNNITYKYRRLEKSRFLTRCFYILYGYSESYEIAYISPNETAIKTSKLPGLVFEKLIEIADKRYPTTKPPAEFYIYDKEQTAYFRISTFDKELLKNSKIDYPRFL